MSKSDEIEKKIMKNLLNGAFASAAAHLALGPEAIEYTKDRLSGMDAKTAGRKFMRNMESNAESGADLSEKIIRWWKGEPNP